MRVWDRVSLRRMVGVVLILLTLALVGPVAIMVGGAIWSALMGSLWSDDADLRASAGQESASAA
jgi:multidrug resistance efflux pump